MYIKQSLVLGLVYSLFTLPSLLVDQNCLAAYLLGYEKANGEFTPLSPENKTYSAARAILDEHEWPSLNSVRDKDLNALTEAKEGAEDRYLNKKLQKHFSSEKKKPTAVWVPTTLWDLFAIRHFSKSEKFWADIKKNDYNARALELFENDLEKNQLKAKLNSEFGAYVKAITGKSLADLSSHLEDQKEVAAQLVKEIIEVRPRTPGLKEEELNRFKNSFVLESKRIKEGHSLIFKILDVEQEAHKKNQGLLWRGTSGKSFSLTSLNPQSPSSSPKPMAAECVNSHDLPQMNLEDLHKIFSMSFKTDKFLDFPVFMRGPLSDLENPVKLMESDIDYLHRGYRSTLKRLSFAYSPLAGFLKDGPFMDGGSACAFIYASEHSDFTYAVPIDKSWFYQNGKDFVFFPKTTSLDGVFEQGETFHPRTFAFDSGFEEDRDESAVDFKKFLKSPIRLSKQAKNRLKEEIKKGIPPEQLVKASNRILEDQDKKITPEELINHLAENYIASINFSLALSTNLFEKSHLLKINDETIDNPAKNEKAQELMLNQGIMTQYAKEALLRYEKPLKD